MSRTTGGAPERLTSFVQILRAAPSRTVCPNFSVLSHATGCQFELFRSEAEGRDRPHALLLVTKSRRRHVEPLAGPDPETKTCTCAT